MNSACDMFQYAASGGACKMYLNSLKQSNIFEIIEKCNGNSIYFLHCSGNQENWVHNADPYTHSRARKSKFWFLQSPSFNVTILDWTLTTDCTEHGISEPPFSQYISRPATQGYQFSNYMKCDAGILNYINHMNSSFETFISDSRNL